MVYYATFFTHFGAIQFREFAKKEQFDCTLMPVPRVLSSSCGTCARYEAKTWDTGFVDEALEGIYGIDEAKKIQVYFKAKE
ncbi:DUF3343 domain-containing protein [uncultured Sphaerochaeta sp.]|uniref:DUF3343 domain-containing protein n=1 Tax=uncultured Sphaerochaeta sp. TaxID=886478 RepID=UPI002A0A5760|nr:DUF3343 domain-containing protein [uncultured Sphaerochaeta sp.]